MRDEAAMLPQYADAQDRSQHSRGCTRCSQAYRRRRAVPALTSRTKESRGAVCTPQTYFEDRPLAVARTHWCSRRIHACSSGSEPTSSCDAHLSGATSSGHRCAQLRRNPPINKATGHQYPVPTKKRRKPPGHRPCKRDQSRRAIEFFNRIGRKRTDVLLAVAYQPRGFSGNSRLDDMAVPTLMTELC